MNKKRLHLIELRKNKKLTQSEVAKLAEIAVSTYSCYEAGLREPDLETMNKISKVLGEKNLVKLFKKGD